MDELINRQAVIDAIHNVDKIFIYCDLDRVIKTIKELPPVQPEIIRCKDCKYWMPYDWMFSEVWQSQNMDDYPEDEIGCAYCDMSMSANDFCSRAERRTNENNTKEEIMEEGRK